MTDEDLIQQASVAYHSAIELFEICDLKSATEEFRKAFQTYRKCKNRNSEIANAAYHLAVCLVETTYKKEQLQEAEDLLIRYTHDGEFIAGKIPRVCVLAKVYQLMKKSKLMRLVSNESIAAATTDEERGCALAGAVYAAIPGTTEAYHYAEEALPLLQATGTQAEAQAIVLEGLARAAEHLPVQVRLEYAYQLASLLKSIPPHPMLPTLYETYMVISYIYTEQGNWQQALENAICAVNVAAINKNYSAVAATYNHISRLYDMMNEPREAAKASFNALKHSMSLHGVDLLDYATEFKKVAERLALYCDFRLAVSAQLLSLRCLIDSDDPTFGQIRESIITLQSYERNVT